MKTTKLSFFFFIMSTLMLVSLMILALMGSELAVVFLVIAAVFAITSVATTKQDGSRA